MVTTVCFMRLKVPEWPGFIFLFLPQPRGDLWTCVNDIWNESSISEFSLKFEASAIRCSIPSVILRHTTRSHRTCGKKRGIGPGHFDFAHVVM